MAAAIKVLYEDANLLVLDKPSGIITHSDGRTIEPSVAEWIAQRYPELAAVGEPWISPQGEHVPVCGLVHRLDRATSGVLLVAKTNKMFAYLKGELKARRVEKKYLAYVYGAMERESGTIIAEIKRTSEKPRRWYAVDTSSDDPRAAITHWRVLGHSGQMSLIELQPMTGRTHQLRVHLAHIGHPIVADHLYAPDRPTLCGFTRPALHAHELSVAINGTRHTFCAPLPEDFRRCVNTLGNLNGSEK